jgi:hypothetical protein
MKARFVGLGTTMLAVSPADFGKLIVAETEKWAKVVKFLRSKAGLIRGITGPIFHISRSANPAERDFGNGSKDAVPAT